MLASQAFTPSAFAVVHAKLNYRPCTETMSFGVELNLFDGWRLLRKMS